MKGLTQRQREIYDYIHTYISTHQFSPSYREIMAHFGFSSLGSVYKHVKVLKRKGLITAEKNCSRSIMLTQEEDEFQDSLTLELPFIGQISAGIPIETFSQTDSMLVPAALVPNPTQSYVLKANGNSLIADCICDGDLMIIEARQFARPGETIVALIGHQETLIKKYYPQVPYVRLESANLKYTPTIIRTEEITIQGVLVGIIRNY